MSKLTRRDTLLGVIEQNEINHDAFVKALREAYPDKLFTDRAIQRYLRQPLRSNYAIAAGVGQDQVLAIVRELRKATTAKAASPFVPEESVDAMLARHQLDRREAVALWLDPMTSLEMFEGLTGLSSVEIRKLCRALELTLRKPHIPQPEVVAPEDDPDPPSIVGLIDMREMVEEALATPALSSEPQEVLREGPVEEPRRHAKHYLRASAQTLEFARSQIAQQHLTRENMRALYDSRTVREVTERYGWTNEVFYAVLGLLDIPLRGKGGRPSYIEPADWPTGQEPAHAVEALDVKEDALPVLRAAAAAAPSNGTAPVEPPPPTLDAAAQTLRALHARRRFLEERMVELKVTLEAVDGEYQQLLVVTEAMDALQAFYVPPQG